MARIVHWNKHEQAVFKRFKSPEFIQEYLDGIPYNSVDGFVRSPRMVMKDRIAQCFDGAMFGSAALESLGYAPLLCDLRAKKGDDDDHVLAIFKRRNRWGAVSKSNFAGLRFREPVYHTLRELVMSYFEHFFNLAGRKTLRDYSMPIDMRRFDSHDWRTTTEDLTSIIPAIDHSRHFAILTPEMEEELSVLDKRSFKAGTVGLDPKGAFRVRG